MINLKAITEAILIESPFPYSSIPDILEEQSINELLINIPQNNYFRSTRDIGSDKTYDVVNNLLLNLGDKQPNLENGLNKCWVKLVNTLISHEYKQFLSKLLKIDLFETYQEITFKKYGVGNFISPHTDKANVRATHMFFLNKDWKEEWGGQLCLMYNECEIFKKIMPLYNNSLAFVRAENSWHTVEKILNPKIERLAIQVAFWNITDRKILPGRKEKTLNL